MKFKVGDKVRVKSLDWYNENKRHIGCVTIGNYNFSKEMSEYCGMTAIITDIASPNTFQKGGFYFLDIDEGRWSWEDCMFEDEVVTENKDVIEDIEVDNTFKIEKGDVKVDKNVQSFKNIANELCDLYEKKNKAYGNSFGDTYKKLGIISAVTRISDKYNRLCNLATNPNIDNLGESIEDTLKDLAAYSIMTLNELRNRKEE